MKKIIIIILILLLVLGAGIAFYLYSVAYTGFNIDKTVYIYVDADKNYERLLEQVKDSAKVENADNFDLIADKLDYKDNLRTGRYAVKPGMTVLDLVRTLRNGNQTPTKLTFNNIRTKEDLAERIAEQLMLSEDDLLLMLNDEAKCRELGFNKQTVVAMFIPNTYEFYWDIKLDTFLERMQKEYNKFWTEARRSKAKAMDLSLVDVSTLASIVEEECYYPDEYPTVAGLYYNRLRKGMLLQADPTVKFAIGDFSLQRVLNKHLEVNSPYNTYKHAGLPPGPIRVPSIKGIDSVLDYKKNNYLYMCAKEDFSGRHNFATTLADHNKNADKYRAALNRRKIY